MVQTLTKSGGDLLLLRGNDAGKERKCEGARADGLGNGEVGPGLHDEIAPGGLQVDGREVGGGGDALPEKQGLEAGAIDGFWQANDEDKPAERATGQRERGQFEAGNF